MFDDLDLEDEDEGQKGDLAFEQESEESGSFNANELMNF
jgi:hypothetical protein